MRRRSQAGSPDEWFQCSRCRQPVPSQSFGTKHRNHCPWCLWSLHVDDKVGDRTNGCKGPMEPIAVWVRGAGEWAIIHHCVRCGAFKSNRIAGDDNEFVLASLAMRPMSHPAFPLERIEENTYD